MEIKLEGATNVRDLGGMLGADGRKIKMGRIIRSSNLSVITERDAEFLKEYGLKRIIDFRTDDEVSANPDRKIDGALHVRCPILKQLTQGITHDEDLSAVSLEEYILNFAIALGDGAREWLRNLYIPLVNDEFSLNGYREFVKHLKENRDGAILYHCSAGKDRVGIGTVIFLSIMGVSREDIIKDYLLTNISFRPSIDGAIRIGRGRGVSQGVLDVVPFLAGVDISYINKAYEIIDTLHGGIDNFLKNQLGLTKEDINSLRENYLE